jgi:hypothetical protein
MASTGNPQAQSGLPESPSPRATELTLADKIREDWRLIKREAKSSADDFKSAFRRLRDWMTREPQRKERGRDEAEVTGLRPVPLTTDR